ncbi:MAG: cell division protein ZapA [Alphaproteobacteria bacterium CG_4_9_14_3_um_filter_47_13]|nr:MAG: cell division protein ZapA [Alphaproteobacteria bacterium CG_4_9_14_3_um_filter_47_13]
MAEVSLNIHGKEYGIACDDGQENRVVEVGQYVDNRARDIASAGAASNENHLLVLTALVLADEVKELRDSLASLQANGSRNAVPPQIVYEGLSEAEERHIVDSIEQLANRIDSVAERLRAA